MVTVTLKMPTNVMMAMQLKVMDVTIVASRISFNAKVSRLSFLQRHFVRISSPLPYLIYADFIQIHWNAFHIKSSFLYVIFYFSVKGSPSLCYMYTSDGICEDFEKYTGSLDCGFHTPDGFIDQWAVSAQASDDAHRHMSIPGPPITKTVSIHEESTNIFMTFRDLKNKIKYSLRTRIC